MRLHPASYEPSPPRPASARTRAHSIRALVIALLALALPASAGAQFFYQSDGGYLELQVDKAGKIKKQQILWIWVPSYAPGSVNYEIFARCTREDANGNFIGKNKVTFSGIKLFGDGVQLGVGGKLSKKLKNGVLPNFLSKEVSTLGLVAGTTATVIGQATVQIKGKLDAGDRIFCAIDVTESP